MATSTIENNSTDVLIRKLTMLELLNNDRKSEKKFCDAKLKAETKEFSVHRVVLGLRSPYFDNLLRTEMVEKYAEVIKVNLSDEKLKMILDYIYTDVANVSTENAMDLLEVAEYTQTESLKSECAEFILKMVDVDNCIKLFAYAQHYNLSKLINMTTQMIAENLAIIIQQEDFVNLEVETLTTLSNQGKVKAQGESLFTGIIRWVNFKLTSRKQWFIKFFSQLDLSTFSSNFLDSTVVTENLVRESNICCLAVLDAMRNLITKDKIARQEKLSVENKEHNELDKQLTKAPKKHSNLAVTDDNPSTSRVTMKSSESTNVPSCFKDFACAVQDVPDTDCPKIGNQPPGQMSDRKIELCLPGYSCNTIEITYSIKSGIQGKEHPNPGQPYHAVGFPRVAYLPNNAEGQNVLCMLKVAWRRGFIFTVGRSLTSGKDNAVTWAGIRHKTSTEGGTHGYPDSTFFANVIYELQAHGITEKDI